MPRMSDINVIYQGEQPSLSIRTRAKVEELPQLIGSSYGKIVTYLNELGELMSDIPFVAYYNMDMQDLDLEIGFPVAKQLPGKGEIQLSKVPAGKVVFCMYRGAYSEIEPTYMEMLEYCQKHELEYAGTTYEFYYNGPGFPEADYLTKIMMLVK